jgi:hypothetical protein
MWFWKSRRLIQTLMGQSTKRQICFGYPIRPSIKGTGSTAVKLYTRKPGPATPPEGTAGVFAAGFEENGRFGRAELGAVADAL